MKKLFLFLIAEFLTLSALSAENTQILKCKVENKEWVASFALDAVANGFLKFKKSGDAHSYTCDLKVDYIQNGQNAIVPNVTFEFVRGTCDPKLGSLDQELFERFTLIVKLLNKNRPEGRVQWLRRKQPDSCFIEKINMFDISINAKKWLEGHWGRDTASDKKN